jgi:parvulin-like peptidyl-prolyl isomerase
MRPWLPLVLSLGLLGAACGKSTETPSAGGGAEDIGETIATVDGTPIGARDFEKAAVRSVPKDGESLTVDERKEILDRLIADKVLYEEAVRKGLDKDPKVQKVMVNTLLRQEVYGQVKNSDFTDEMLQAYFTEHPDEFEVPEKVQIKRILIRITDQRPEAQAKKVAEEVHGQLAANPKDSFKDVAAKYSEDPYRRRGGDVGFVSRESKPGLDSAIVEKAFSMDVDTLSDVFQTSEGFNIIYVANKRAKVERTFQQMKGSVLRKVKNQRLKDLYDQYVAKLRQGSTIEVKEDRLAAVEVQPAVRAAMPPGMQVNPVLGNPMEALEGAGDEEVPALPGEEQAMPGGAEGQE